MKALAIAVLALGVLASTTARADTPPSAWDRVKDPTAGESYRLHVEVQRRLASAARMPEGIQEAQARTVRTLLERYNAAESKDLRLRFDLGSIYDELKDYDKAAMILGAALAQHPEHPAAEAAWSVLASACGHTGDRDCERRAYNEQLKYSTEDIRRGTPTLNLAETEMHSGNLREAIDGYREALRLSARDSSATLAPLAVWGLAVALDRSGDRLGAEKEARFARDLEHSMGMQNLLRSRHVFFFPAYEVHWYEGLGAAVAAHQATTPNEILGFLRSSEQSFTNYVRFAEIATRKDRWLEQAKLRQATAKAEREKAEKKYGKEPPRQREDDERELNWTP